MIISLNLTDPIIHSDGIMCTTKVDNAKYNKNYRINDLL
jgi:hypothetical protein